jgi:molybdopterin synthase sulfur carrier subunit
VTLLYFAWVRQKLGIGEESMDLPADVHSVADLSAFLASRGGAYGQVFGDPSGLRAAVNQEHAKWDTVIATKDEVAFFPPVTGG